MGHVTPWSNYMAQSPKGRLIHGVCAIYLYPGVVFEGTPGMLKLTKLRLRIFVKGEGGLIEKLEELKQAKGRRERLER